MGTRPARGSGAVKVGIVVPVLNEEELIGDALARLTRDFPDCDLVVVDGGSSDATTDIAALQAKVVTSEPGRGRQMNRGTEECRGEVLWFVHADTEIDPAALGQIRDTMSDPDVVGGGLKLRFDRRSIGLDYLAWSSNQRAKRLQWIFGDQAMFVRRSAFDALGGFPDMVLFEDMEMSRRLSRAGRLVMLPATSTASSRRIVEHGTWRMIAFMQYLKLLYFAGVDAESIRRSYERGPHIFWNKRGIKRVSRTGPVGPSS